MADADDRRLDDGWTQCGRCGAVFPTASTCSNHGPAAQAEPDPPPNEKPSRLNLELDPKTKRRLDSLKVRSEAASLTETIRRALVIMEWVIDAEGEIVHRRKDGSETTLKLIW